MLQFLKMPLKDYRGQADQILLATINDASLYRLFGLKGGRFVTMISSTDVFVKARRNIYDGSIPWTGIDF